MAAKLALESTLSANQFEVDRKSTLILNEKWIRNFRDILSAYFESAFNIYRTSMAYINISASSTAAQPVDMLVELNGYKSKIINLKSKLALFLNDNQEKEYDILTKIINFNSWLLNLTDLDDPDVEDIVSKHISLEGEILNNAQQIIRGTLSSIFTKGEEEKITSTINQS